MDEMEVHYFNDRLFDRDCGLDAKCVCLDWKKATCLAMGSKMELMCLHFDINFNLVSVKCLWN